MALDNETKAYQAMMSRRRRKVAAQGKESISVEEYEELEAYDRTHVPRKPRGFNTATDDGAEGEPMPQNDEKQPDEKTETIDDGPAPSITDDGEKQEKPNDEGKQPVAPTPTVNLPRKPAGAPNADGRSLADKVPKVKRPTTTEAKPRPAGVMNFSSIPKRWGDLVKKSGKTISEKGTGFVKYCYIPDELVDALVVPCAEAVVVAACAWLEKNGANNLAVAATIAIAPAVGQMALALYVDSASTRPKTLRADVKPEPKREEPKPDPKREEPKPEPEPADDGDPNETEGDIDTRAPSGMVGGGA